MPAARKKARETRAGHLAAAAQAGQKQVDREDGQAQDREDHQAIAAI